MKLLNRMALLAIACIAIASANLILASPAPAKAFAAKPSNTQKHPTIFGPQTVQKGSQRATATRPFASVGAGGQIDDVIPVTEFFNSCSTTINIDANTETSDGGIGNGSPFSSASGKGRSYYIANESSTTCVTAVWESASFTQNKNCRIAAYINYYGSAVVNYSVEYNGGSSTATINFNQNPYLYWTNLNSTYYYNIQYVQITSTQPSTQMGMAGLDFVCTYPNAADAANDCSLDVQSLQYQPNMIQTQSSSDHTPPGYLVNSFYGFTLGSYSWGSGSVASCWNGNLSVYGWDTQQCYTNAGFPTDVYNGNVCNSSNGEYGYEFQCVELAAKYAAERWGVPTSIWTDAQNDNPNKSSAIAKYFYVVSFSSARPGDIIDFSYSSTAGHIGVVVGYPSGSSISVMSQNYSYAANASFNNGSYVTVMRRIGT